MMSPNKVSSKTSKQQTDAKGQTQKECYKVWKKYWHVNQRLCQTIIACIDNRRRFEIWHPNGQSLPVLTFEDKLSSCTQDLF